MSCFIENSCVILNWWQSGVPLKIFQVPLGVRVPRLGTAVLIDSVGGAGLTMLQQKKLIIS